MPNTWHGNYQLLPIRRGWDFGPTAKNTPRVIANQRPLISLSAYGRKSRSSGKRLWLFYFVGRRVAPWSNFKNLPGPVTKGCFYKSPLFRWLRPVTDPSALRAFHLPIAPQNVRYCDFKQSDCVKLNSWAKVQLRAGPLEL